MIIKYYGHSCFLIDNGNKRLLTDPYDSYLGYAMPTVTADIVTASHHHEDHSALDRIQNATYSLVDTAGYRDLSSFEIRGIHTYHDPEGGALRGENNVYVINDNVSGLNICHMGDIGEPVTPDIAAAIGHVDILLIPVGGTFTITTAEAVDYVKALKPALVIPMHYRTPRCNFPIMPVDFFLRAADEYPCLRVEGDSLNISADTLPTATTVAVLTYHNS